MWKVHILCFIWGRKGTLVETHTFDTPQQADTFRRSYNDDRSRVHRRFYFIAQGPYAAENMHIENTMERA